MQAVLFNSQPQQVFAIRAGSTGEVRDASLLSRFKGAEGALTRYPKVLTWGRQRMGGHAHLERIHRACACRTPEALSKLCPESEAPAGRRPDVAVLRIRSGRER